MSNASGSFDGPDSDEKNIGKNWCHSLIFAKDFTDKRGPPMSSVKVHTYNPSRGLQ